MNYLTGQDSPRTTREQGPLTQLVLVVERGLASLQLNYFTGHLTIQNSSRTRPITLAQLVIVVERGLASLLQLHYFTGHLTIQNSSRTVREQGPLDVYCDVCIFEISTKGSENQLTQNNRHDQ